VHTVKARSLLSSFLYDESIVTANKEEQPIGNQAGRRLPNNARRQRSIVTASESNPRHTPSGQRRP
jgi:hypothetical protein